LPLPEGPTITLERRNERRWIQITSLRG
jgi:hypothetical protein